MVRMIAWGWLIVAFMAGMTAGLFLTALMRANDPYREQDTEPPWLEKPDEAVIVKDTDGNMVKYDVYGIAVYDPETGTWKSIN